MDLSVQNIVDTFREINRIPRCSTNESGISQWLLEWAKKHNFEGKKDEYNNVLIIVPPSSGYEHKPPIAIQGHMDMVCEKTDTSTHDFTRDPINIYERNGWLVAENTTLGADDGIALAVGLTLATHEKHPPLELLFTSSEEVGLVGAMNMDEEFFKSKLLINVDSEREGEITIGCAGGEDTHLNCPIELEDPGKSKAYTLTVSGLKGGHSGTCINLHRANAIKVGARILKALNDRHKIRILSIDAGSARNAIPASLSVSFITKEEQDPIHNTISQFKATLKREYKHENIEITMNEAKNNKKSLSIRDTERLINLLQALPHGIYELTDSGSVETSNNLARVYNDKNEIHIFTNQRSLLESKLSEITQTIHSIAYLSGYNASTSNRYPPWQPNYSSPLLKKSIEIYRKLFNREPAIKTVHAGLECGVIASKRSDVDMISIGPTIENPHTPKERLNLASLERLWSFIVELVQTV